MQTPRRQLMLGAAALAALPAAAAAPSLVLWGDGVHDDTDALRAVIRDEDVRWSTGESVKVDGERNIHQRWFYVRSDSGFSWREVTNMPSARGMHVWQCITITSPLAFPHDFKKG